MVRQESTTQRPGPLPVSALSFLPCVPRRTQVSPGIWTDGGTTVFSSALPEVQKLLADARETLVLPTPSSDIILALAALDVFYKPGDPAHWMFWSDDKKNATADVVTRISLHTPPLVQSPVAWNGKPEYLSLLATHHGSSWKQLYETQEWYTVLVPPKPSTPPRSLNLRRRKVLPGAFREPSPLEDELDELTVRNANRAASPPPKATAVEAPPSKGRTARSKPKALNATHPPPATEVLLGPIQMSLSPLQTLTPLSDLAELSPEPSANGTRRKRKISPPSRYPEQISTGKECPLESGGSSLLLSLAPGEGASKSAIHTHSRNRSTSTDSSSGSTIIQSIASRSSSVLSGVTIVGSNPAASTGKRKANSIEETESLDNDTPETEGEDGGTVTRGRSARFKKQVKNTSPDDVAATARAIPQQTRKKVRKV